MWKIPMKTSLLSTEYQRLNEGNFLTIAQFYQGALADKTSNDQHLA